MKAGLSAAFANAATRRDPTSGEISGGFPCGPADIELFNELDYRATQLGIELEALLTAAGITPSDGNLTQVLQAVRSQAPNYVATVGGTANALTITLSPAPAAWTALVGVPLRLLIATTNTGAATLNPNSLGTKAIVRHNGTAIGAGELLAGAIETVVYDGTSVRLSAPATKARSWRMSSPSGNIPNSVETRITSFGSSSSNMPASTVNASAGTVTIGAADAGVYVLSAEGAVSAGTTVDTIGIRVNGTGVSYQSMQGPSAVSQQDPNTCAVVTLASGDVVDSSYLQTSGGSNALVAGAWNHFAGVRIGD